MREQLFALIPQWISSEMKFVFRNLLFAVLFFLGLNPLSLTPAQQPPNEDVKSRHHASHLCWLWAVTNAVLQQLCLNYILQKQTLTRDKATSYDDIECAVLTAQMFSFHYMFLILSYFNDMKSLYRLFVITWAFTEAALFLIYHDESPVTEVYLKDHE